MQVKIAVGFFANIFWREVFENNWLQGLNFKYYSSPFSNASAELVLEAVSVDVGAPGASQMAA